MDNKYDAIFELLWVEEVISWCVSLLGAFRDPKNVFLGETKCSASEIKCFSIKYISSVMCELITMLGGLALFWQIEVDVTMRTMVDHFINVNIH